MAFEMCEATHVTDTSCEVSVVVVVVVVVVVLFDVTQTKNC